MRFVQHSISPLARPDRRGTACPYCVAGFTIHGSKERSAVTLVELLVVIAINTNTIYLQESLLGPYLGRAVGVWRCPADPSTSRHDGQILPRVRSYSMNIFMNAPNLDLSSRWKVFKRTTHISSPSPSEVFVLIDEREDSIEDGTFQMDMENVPIGFGAVPRAAHNRAGTLSFADGHVENHKWRDSRTQPPVEPNAFVALRRTAPNNPDAIWLNQRATGLRR